MKIGIDGRVLSKPGSGIVRYSFELTQHLIEKHPEHEYTIYVSKNDDWKKKVKFRGKYSTRQISLPKPAWRTKLFTDILDRDKIDVYHSMALVVPYVPSWLRKVAIVQTCHGINPNEYWTSIRDELYWRPTLRAGAFFSDRIICMSDDCRQVMHKRYNVPLERMDVGYFGLSEDLRPLSKEEKARASKYLQKKYGVPKEGFILYVGGTLKNKNIQTVLKAWEALKERYDFNLPIVIARLEYGSIIEGRSVEDRMNELGLKVGNDVIAINWIGKDLGLFYACAPFTIYPSLFEGLGYPILESMACGTPVITSNASALPEAAGGAALLVNSPCDENEWADKIQKLYADRKLQEKLVKLGLKRAKSFTWEKVANGAIESYGRALKSKKK